MQNLPTNQDPAHNTYANGRPATEKQLGFIKSLRDGRELSEVDAAKLGRALDRGFNTREASDIIKWLQAQPVKAVEITAPVAVAELAAGQSSPEPTEVTEGMWTMAEVIYKVQKAVHGSGHLYAKRLVVSPEFEGQSVTFEYTPGAVKQLEVGGRKLTLEEAKAFGALYGTCCVCGRTLTKESSIEDGIGPICASKL